MDTIVVVRLGRLGDVTLTGPTVKNLRITYPESKILFVTRESYRTLAERLPGVDTVLVFPDGGSYIDLIRLSSRIEEFNPTLIVDLHKNFRSFHLAKLTKAPYKVVYHKRRQQRLAAVNEKEFVSPIPHTVDLYNAVLDELKGQKLVHLPDLELPDEPASQGGIRRDGVAIAPGASSPVKAWPPQRFALLAERIMYDFKYPIRLLLGEGEEHLQEHFQHLPQDKLTVYQNRPLPDVVTLLSRCRLAVTNDTGLMHISSAVGTPTAALFGPTHEQLGFYPLGVHDLLLGTNEPCRPCSLHGNKPCYRQEQYCFTLLTVDAVYERIAEMLDNIKLEPAAFIDRDGTLIVDRHFLADPDKIEFLPGSLEAVTRLKKAGYRIVVISNQSGVGRGFFPVETVDLVHERLSELMTASGCAPDNIQYCPHYPDGEEPQYTMDCDCRKPKGGMLESAASSLGIDLKRSFMIGDKYSDVLCGRVVGTRSILVRSGEGKATEKELPSHSSLRPYHIGDDLAAAADYILSR